jgi:glycosyltransferase involved in cell wall biosynthesis
MRITFVLPGSARFPIGGYKVAFEYANHLTDRGHVVTVVMPAMVDPEIAGWEKLYHAGRYLLWGATQLFGPQRWFRLHPSIRLAWTPSLRERYIPDADAIVATGWLTSEFVAGYSESKGRKHYLIQHYETWCGPEERVRATWKLPLRKIVIARWLQEIAESMGETAAYIPNGLDFSAFGCDVPIEQRTKPSVTMLYHQWQWKGTADGLKALEIAHGEVPELQAILFGVTAPGTGLPPWITYVRNPPQAELRKIYNRTQVFVTPSWTEGWPLPPAEAMMSGAALVCTDIGGHREYATHERNALMAPAQDPQALGAAISRMLTDDTLRHRLAATALSDISRFTWSAAVDRFERELQSKHSTAEVTRR